MYKNVKKKMLFMLHLMIHLTVQLRGAPEGTLEGVCIPFSGSHSF